MKKRHLSRHNEQFHHPLVEGIDDILPSSHYVYEVRSRGATGMRQLGI